MANESNIVKLIKSFFEADNGRKITVSELQALSHVERVELATLISVETGIPLILSDTTS